MPRHRTDGTDHRPRHRPHRPRARSACPRPDARSARACASSRSRSAATTATTTMTTTSPSCTRRRAAPRSASRPMRISRALLDEIIAHARADAPNECCGMIASRDGEAVAVHRATTPPPARCATSWTRRAVPDPGRDRGRRARSRRDLPLAHALGPDPVADRHQPGALGTGCRVPGTLYVIVGVKADEADVRAWAIVDGGVEQLDARDRRDLRWIDGPLVCPSCGAAHAGSERFCRDCGMPAGLRSGRRQARGPAPRCTSARARSGRSTPRSAGPGRLRPPPGRGRDAPGDPARSGRPRPDPPLRRLRRPRLPRRRAARHPRPASGAEAARDALGVTAAPQPPPRRPSTARRRGCAGSRSARRRDRSASCSPGSSSRW